MITLTCLILLFQIPHLAQAKGTRLNESDYANIIEVTGDLIVRNANAHPMMSIREHGREIQLTNVHTHWRSCLNGVFLITNDQSDVRLIDVLECQEQISFDDVREVDQQALAEQCPEIDKPVCGLDKNALLQEMRTFSNLCHLNGQMADFLHYGECR